MTTLSELPDSVKREALSVCAVNDAKISGGFLSDPALWIIGKKIGFPVGYRIGIGDCPTASARGPVRAAPALPVIALPLA
jgi:hypothetical protein